MTQCRVSCPSREETDGILPQAIHFCSDKAFTPSSDQLTVADAVIHDFNDTTKTKEFLSHESLDFTFICPDRQIQHKMTLKIT